MITFLVWQVVVGQDFAFAIERTVTVMVIACPHALGLAVPLVVAVSTALAASNGVLLRNRVAFEGARKLQAIIFDKTGTLTEGRFGGSDTLILGDERHQHGQDSQCIFCECAQRSWVCHCEIKRFSVRIRRRRRFEDPL